MIALPPLLALAPRAEASTARLVTLEQLLERSTYVVVGTAGERRCAWEDLPSGRRIVTYTQVLVERAVAGTPASQLTVRTLGGAVNHIGQSVAGEVQLFPGARSMLFLAQFDNLVVITAAAQGHYPIVVDANGIPRLARSPDVDMLIPRPGPTIAAHERLVGLPVEDAVALVKQVQKGAR